MERERTRSRADLAVLRSPESVGGGARPLRPSRDRRGSSDHWSGLHGFLAALPRVFGSASRDGREIANDRPRSTFGNDAA